MKIRTNHSDRSRAGSAPLRLLCLFLLVAGLGARLAAAPPGGVVSGRVTNGGTGDVLNGAIITVPGTQLSTFSARDGSYRVEVPPGNASIQVEFTGLKTQVIPVQVAAGETSMVDVKLTSDVYKMDPYVVHTITEGNAQALQEERELPNISEIAATDAFGIPSPNPGELLMKLPGISVDITGSTVRTIYVRGMPSNFVNIMVDGNMMASSAGTSAGRQIQIEQFGTADLQETQLLLEPTPDMDADQIGGVINLVTKRVYDVPNSLQLTVGTNWVDAQDASEPSPVRPGHPDFNIIGSHTFSVFGHKNNLGIEYSYNHNAQAATEQDEHGTMAQVAPATGMLYNGVAGNNTGGPLQTAYGRGYISYGLPKMDAGGLDVDYKISDGSSFSLRSTYTRNYYEQQLFRWWVTVPNNMTSFLPGSTPDFETTQPTVGTAETLTSNFTKKSVNYSVNPELVLSTAGGAGTLDINGMVSWANVWYPGYVSVTSVDRGTGFSLNRVGAGPWDPTFIQTSGPSYTSANSYTPLSASHIAWGAPDTLSEARVDYTQNLPTAFQSFIKTGAKYSNEEREAYEGDATYSGFSGPTNQGITPWLGEQFVTAGAGPFPYVNVPGDGNPHDPIAQGLFNQTAADGFGSTTTTDAASVRYQEDLSDAYAEASATFGKFNILAGIRGEHTVVEGQQRDKVPGAANASLTAAQNAALAQAQFGAIGTDTAHYTDYMPGVFLTYQPFAGTLIKGSYNVTVTRPPIANILPGESVNLTTQTISIQNPALQPYTSHNFEFNIAQYFEPVGQFEAGVFVKQIKNYIATQSFGIGSGVNPALDAEFDSTYRGYTATTSVNYGTARFRGCYFAYQQTYNQLPGLLRGLGFFGNMTFLETEGNYGGLANLENLTSFTPFTANYGVSYVHAPLQLWLTANYRGNYLIQGTYINSLNGVTQLHRTVVGLNGDYILNKNWDLFCNINNLTNEYTTAYVYGGQPYGSYLQGISFTTGIRFTFK